MLVMLHLDYFYCNIYVFITIVNKINFKSNQIFNKMLVILD